MSAADARLDLDRIGREALPGVLDALLGFPASELPSAGPGVREPAGEILWATVQLCGPRVSGAVHLLLPRSFASAAVVRLLGTAHHPTPDSAADVAGELCNMAAGQVAARLRLEGYPCELGIPDVVQEPAVGGAALLPSHPEVQQTTSRQQPRPTDHGRTDWSCQGHRITLEIRLDYPPT